VERCPRVTRTRSTLSARIGRERARDRVAPISKIAIIGLWRLSADPGDCRGQATASTGVDTAVSSDGARGAALTVGPVDVATWSDAVCAAMPLRPGMVPFRVGIPEAELDDLRLRLRRTRWPDAEPVDDWSQGVPLRYLQQLCRYWADEYDWRATEARFNAWPQRMVEISGLGIHVLDAPSPHPGALPLVLTHGWPGSVVEFLDVLGPLTDPPAYGGDAADAFHVVCPSLPGYGFSDKPTRAGWGVERIADAWAELMARLGHRRYGAAGSDWGTTISTLLAQRDRAHVAGTYFPAWLLTHRRLMRSHSPHGRFDPLTRCP
jgi:hypothetical protein